MNLGVCNRDRKRMMVYAVIYILFLLYGMVSGIYHDDIAVGERIKAMGLMNVYKSNVALGGWSSRFIVDFVWFVFLDKFPMWFWVGCNALIPTVCIICIDKLQGEKNNTLMLAFSTVSVLLFPYITVQTAGVLATTITYWWTACCAAICITLMSYSIFYKRNIWVLFLCGGTGLYAGDDELGCIFLVVACVAICISALYSKKEILVGIVLEILFVIRLFVHYYWKCNGGRMDSEMQNWFVDYQQQSFFDKIQIGFSTLCYAIFKEYPLVLFVFCLILCVLVFSRTNSIFQRCIALYPLMLVAVQGMFRIIFISSMGYLNSLDASYSAQYGMVSNGNCYYWHNYMMLILWGVALVCIMVSVVNTMEINEAVCILGVLGAGFLSKLAMGFSPTVAASGVRTASFLFMSIIICTIYCGKKVFTYNKKIWERLSLGIIVIGGISYINNLLSLVV